ncbi:MAG: glutathione S-transferase family protein [Caulobacteraceae bacterium]
MELIIGDKVWSSWSMRPWLVLKHAGAPFTEIPVRLRRLESHDEILAAGSPSGMVPALKDGDLTVWDSLAICEYAAEKFPDAGLWPKDSTARALGRSAAAEMHSGFHSLRGECPMDLSLRTSAQLVEATATDVRRIVGLWSDLLKRCGGPFLLGDWSIADAFFTPVATRFRSYDVRLSDYGDAGPAGSYAERLLEAPEFIEWEKDALGAARP